MARPKVLSEDVVRVEVTIPWEEAVALNAVAEESGVSKMSLLRLFISSGLNAYTNAWADVLPSSAPPASGPRKPQP